MSPYLHYVKQAQPNTVGSTAPKPVASPTPAMPAANYPWREGTPEKIPSFGQRQTRKDIDMMSARQAYEANYGPELTERLRQSARAYQQANLPAMQEFGAQTPMPNYDRQYFDRPLRVLNKAYNSSGVFPAYAFYGRAARSNPVYDVAAGVFPFLKGSPHDIFMNKEMLLTNGQNYYDSVLQHEFNHSLQLHRPSGGDAQRVLANENIDEALPHQSHYHANPDKRHMPYSRFPMEVAPVVSEAKLEYFKKLQRDEAWGRTGKPKPVPAPYDPSSWESWSNRIANNLASQQFAISSMQEQGKSPEQIRSWLQSDSYRKSIADNNRADINRRAANSKSYRANAEAYNNKLEAARRLGYSDAGEAMNFDNPEHYQRFLEWMKSQPSYGDGGRDTPSDAQWILDLPPRERDLYFRGVASNQPYSQYQA
jgi:hypothetical protein